MGSLNQMWQSLLEKNHQELAEDNYIICTELTEEYFLTQLLALSQPQLLAIAEKAFGDVVETETRVRRVMAVTTLAYSYWVLAHPVKGTRL